MKNGDVFRMFFLALLTLLLCSAVWSQWFGITAHDCQLCGSKGYGTDLTLVDKFDGTSRGGVTFYNVYRCPKGHLFTEADP